MRVRVEYQDGVLDFEGADDRLVAAFSAPRAAEGDARARARLALESPIDYPPLRQVVVPGDRVAVPIDPSLPGIGDVLSTIAEILGDVGVESIAAILDGRDPRSAGVSLPGGIERVVHDPTDRESLAYLASTASGRRVYLNRRLADADCVVPVGRIGPDDALGIRGPWSVIDPGLSDATPAPRSLLASARGLPPGLEESIEISWLLGSQFQVGGVPAGADSVEVICGQAAAVRDRGLAMLDRSWGVMVDERADLVVAGLGGTDRPATAEDLLEGLRNALGLVRRGGKVALLTRLGIDTFRDALLGPHLPRGDWEKAQAWADIYVAASAEADDLDELGVIPLDRPDQASRLAANAPSFIAVGQVDRASVSVRTEAGPA